MAVLPPRKQIEEQVAGYRQALAKKASTLTLQQAMSEYQSRSQKLYQLLLKPVESSFSSIKRLIIVPDGVLAYLPFETLGEKTSGHISHLLERFAIAYAPSASALASINEKAKDPISHPKLFLAKRGQAVACCTKRQLPGAGSVVRC